MSLIVIGLSHHTAPLGLLERFESVSADALDLARTVLRDASVSEALVLSTCNRLEIYAETTAFHPAVAAIGEALAERADTTAPELAEHLYVRYDDRAIAHAFTVASGLDSMAVGESQILGQMREALGQAQRESAAGTSLNALFQHALRVGKRAHSETAIDQHSVSLMQAGLDAAREQLGELAQVRAAVIGAGGMSGLAVATLHRAGIQQITVVNRTAERADRLAESVSGQSRPWSELADVISESDLVVTSTGAVGQVITGADVAAASARHGGAQSFIDLALPRDIEPLAAWPSDVPNVQVVDLVELGDRLQAQSEIPAVAEVRDLVTAEVADYLARRAHKSVAPTVAALRARAAEVVANELARLDQRLPALEPAHRAEVELAVHRVVEKLLHAPTVRVKEFAISDGDPTASDEGTGRTDYAAVLRELFDLEPRDLANVEAPPQRGVAHE